MHNGKGKPISNLSEPIHSVCTIAITTQEGSNAAWEWIEMRQYSRESSARKKNKTERTGEHVHVHEINTGELATQSPEK